MNFQYNEDQTIIKDSIRKYLDENYSFEQRNKKRKEATPFCKETWKKFAELGWLSIPFDEAEGGFCGSAIELMLMFEELGRALVISPILETLVLAGGLLRRTNYHGRYNKIISKLMAGQWLGALAHEEESTSYSVKAVTTCAVSADNCYRINGKKQVVFNARQADHIVVSVILEDGSFGLILVPHDAEGLILQSYPTVDSQHASDVLFHDVTVASHCLLASGEEAEKALLDTLNDGILCLAAEHVGMMDVLIDTTIEYTKDRKQFGTSISKFQVLQHRMVDMFIDKELTLSLLFAAAIKLRDKADDEGKYISAIKVKADTSAKRVVHSAFQLHGGIATTDELKIGHYLKRIAINCERFGGTAYHKQRYYTLR